MRRGGPLGTLVVLVACSRTASPGPSAVELPPPGDAGPVAAQSIAPPPATTPPPPAKRCLPVVAAECNCVYECGVGVETAPGVWSVTHKFWKGSKLQAKVARWCFNGDCTDAFHADIVCDGICGGKPADHGCHFDGDRCLGSSP